jgi:hypothetical protein
MSRKIVVEVGGRTFEGEVMTVRSTMLGWEDHGIFTAMLDLESPSSGQSAGAYFLDDRREREDDAVGTASGVDYLQRIMRVVQVRSWEKVQGQQVIALRAEPYGSVVGIANIADDDDGRVFVFQDWAEEWQGLRKGRVLSA